MGRLTTLEKRLQEKLEENEDLQAQLRRAREAAQSAIQTREEMQKKVGTLQRLGCIFWLLVGNTSRVVVCVFFAHPLQDAIALAVGSLSKIHSHTHAHTRTQT